MSLRQFNRGRDATSKMRCVDVAALFAAAILRRNPESVVIPFDTQAYEACIDPSDSVLSLAERLARYGGGGTDCSLPLAAANTKYRYRRSAGCVLVCDNQNWVYRGQPLVYGNQGSTGMLDQWQRFVQNQLRLVGHAAPLRNSGASQNGNHGHAPRCLPLLRERSRRLMIADGLYRFAHPAIQEYRDFPRKNAMVCEALQ